MTIDTGETLKLGIRWHKKSGTRNKAGINLKYQVIPDIQNECK
jgi:hypothetical protein